MPRPFAPSLAWPLLCAMAAAQTPDWHRLPVMTSLAAKGLAFDSVRERMVLFESSERGGLSRTWEWVGSHWSLRRTVTSPPPRQGFSAGYDPRRGRFVMFGGSANYLYTQAPNSVQNDTWEYDGIDWVQRSPLTSPPPQLFGWLGFDFQNQQLLLCGGEAVSGAGGAWSYDGNTWTAAAPAPFVARSTAIASDPARRRVVAHTSRWLQPTAPTGFTYEWNGSVWTTMQPATTPPPRTGGAMAYVQQRGAIIMHGGVVTSGNTTTLATDLWQWDGLAWTPISMSAPARATHSMAHDPRLNRTFVVGGYTDSDTAADTMQWDGTHWHRQDNALGWDAFVTVVHDASQGTIVGAAHNPPRMAEWNGVEWHFTPLPPGMARATGLTFDRLLGRLVAVGLDSTLTMATWERIGTVWSQPVPSPGLPTYAALFYHVAQNRVLAFSAQHGLWARNGANWMQVAPGIGTINGHNTQVVYDVARNEVVVAWDVGGLRTSTWNGVTWAQHPLATAVPPRANFVPLTLGYDDARQRVVLFGGRSMVTGASYWNYYQFHDDLWEWDGTTWSQRVLAHAPLPREGASIVFDATHNQLLLIAGSRQEYSGAGLPFGDVWAPDATATASVTVLGPGCGSGTGSGSGPPRIVPSHPHPGAMSFTVDLYATQAAAPSLFVFGIHPMNTPLGNGCTSHVAAVAASFTTTNAGCFASATCSIPRSLQGFSFVAQAAVLDAGAALGFVLTQGLQITTGR